MIDKNDPRNREGESGAAASFLLSKYLGKLRSTVNQTVQRRQKIIAYFHRLVV